LTAIQDVIEEMPGARIKLISKGFKQNYKVTFTDKINVGFSRDRLKEVILKNYGSIL
jgi:hypothetical protein